MSRKQIANIYARYFSVFIILPVLLILFLLNNIYSRALINIETNNKLQLLTNIKTSIDNEMRHRVFASLNIGINYEILSLANRWHNEQHAPIRYTLDMDMRRRLSQPMLFMNEYETIAFYFRDGEDAYFFGSSWLAPYEARKTSWYQNALANSGLLVIDSSIREVNNRKAVALSISPGPIIFNNEVEVIYFSFFVDFIQDYALDQGTTIITDRNGAVIFDTRERYGELCLNELIQAHGESSIQTINGEQVLVLVASLPMTGWRIVRLYPYRQIVDQVRSITVYGYFASSIYLAFFVLFSVLFYQRILKPVLQLEIQAMQYQITPHFIINTLNSIKVMALISKQKNIVKITEAFMQLLSSILGKTGTHITIREEIQNIKHYVHIMKVRFGDSFTAEYDIDEGIEDFSVLCFLLQPIVENAIIHGLNGKCFGGKIRIKGYCKKGKIVFEVFDNGGGMTEDEIKKMLKEKRANSKGFLSMGFSNVNQRIKLNYGRGFGLRLESKPDEYTCVIFELPMQRMV